MLIDFPINKKKYIILNINSGELALERRWQIDNFIELSKYILDTYDIEIILIGGKNEKEYVSKYVFKMEKYCNKIIDTSGKISIKELMVLFQKALFFITNDSGPLHLGNALKVPLAVFFGPETPVLFGPIGEKKIVFYTNERCSPCISSKNKKAINCIHNNRCLTNIKPINVFNEIKKIIDEAIQ